jgi:predicted XRE-type DNA-binding protein
MTELPKYKSKKLAQLTRSSELAVLKIKKLQAEIDHLTRQNQLRQHQIADILDGDK